MGRLASMGFAWLVILVVLQQLVDASNVANGKAPVKGAAAKPVQDASKKQQHSHALQNRQGPGGCELQAKHPCIILE